MMPPAAWEPTLTESDLEFVVGEAAPEAHDKDQLKRLVREDREFRNAIVGDVAVFERLMSDDDALVKVSPALYFEVLLRRALSELEGAGHTLERTVRQSIPVFDTQEVVDLLAQPDVLDYLSTMLASFTRIRSFTTPVRVRKGIRHRITYNDMDVDSLLRFCSMADEAERFGYYRRIADVCLFLSEVFAGHTAYDTSYAASGRQRPSTTRGMRRGLEDYEREGRRFYGLAEKHPTARTIGLSGVLGLLREHFTSARKPLASIAAQYLHSRKRQFFGAQA